MNRQDLRDRVRSILETCSTMTLATCGPNGPWAADVFFASDGLRAHYFISSPSSRHAREGLGAGVAAATVHPDPGDDWRSIRGLQIEGALGAVEDAEVASARAIYLAKFPFAAALLQRDSEVATKTAGTRFYLLRALRLYLVDNSLGFGNRQEIDLGAE